MTEDRLTDRLVDEIDALRYDVRNLCDGFAIMRERLDGFMNLAAERDAMASVRIGKLEISHEKSKKMLWMVSGAWVLVLAAWSAREIWWR